MKTKQNFALSRDRHGTGKKTPGGAGTHTGQTHEPHKPNPLKTNPPTDSRARPHPNRASPHPNPGTHASPQTAPHTPSSEVVVTDMATAPRRGSGSGEGASLTASVAALLRVPGGAEVRSFGVRERLMALTVHARQGPGITRDAPLSKQKTEGLMA